MTQAERLFKLLRRRRYTYLELLMTGISTAPWKRLREEEHKLFWHGEYLWRDINREGRATFQVKKL